MDGEVNKKQNNQSIVVGDKTFLLSCVELEAGAHVPAFQEGKKETTGEPVSWWLRSLSPCWHFVPQYATYSPFFQKEDENEEKKLP